jgi:hypothetical protein
MLYQLELQLCFTSWLKNENFSRRFLLATEGLGKGTETNSSFFMTPELSLYFNHQQSIIQKDRLMESQ